MNAWRKVGCCLVAAVAAFGSMSVSAKGIEGIFVSAESSGDYPGTTFQASNAFIANYWLAAGDANWPTKDIFIQANLSEPYRPVSYTIDVTDVDTTRIPQAFRLKGWSEELQAWDTLDVQVGVMWSTKPADKPWKKTFAVSTSRSYTKLRLDLLQPLSKTPSQSRPFSIWTLKFEDEGADALSAVDLVCAARAGSSGVALASCEVESGCVANLFDGELGADLTSDAADNGRWLANKSVGERSVTLAFGGVGGFLAGYGLRMKTGTDDAGVLAGRRLPSAWRVYASPTDGTGGDDWTLVDEQGGVASGNWTTRSVKNADTAVLDVELSGTKKYCQARRLKFVFDSSVDDEDFVQLGEIALRGAFPNESGTVDCYVADAAVESVSHQAATVQVIVFPKSGEIASYDLFFDCVHEDRTNVIRVASSCTALGARTYALDKLKVGTDYVLQARIVNASGSVSRGPELEVQTEAEDAVEFPDGFNKLEWVQSTEDGHQGIILGAQPQNFGLEVDCIFYNALAKGNNWDSTTNTYGVLYAGDSAFMVSTSTGQGGDYSSGLRLDSRPRAANLSAEIIGKRIQIAHRGTYTVTPEGGVPQSDSRDASLANSRICLMGGFNASAPTGMDQWSVMRLYSVTVYKRHDDDTVTHFYQPAQASDGTNGLLDLLDENPETAWYPCVGETNLVAGAILPAGSCSAAVDSFTGTRLKVTLTRENSVLEDAILAVWGPDYGGLDTSAWAHQKALGKSFKAGEQTAAVTLKGLADSDVYVRFYTANGRWSQTIYLPDLERKRSGMVLILK